MFVPVKMRHVLKNGEMQEQWQDLDLRIIKKIHTKVEQHQSSLLRRHTEGWLAKGWLGGPRNYMSQEIKGHLASPSKIYIGGGCIGEKTLDISKFL